MKRVSVDLGLSLVGPGTICTVLGAATGAAAGTMLLGPGGTVAGAVYGAKGGRDAGGSRSRGCRSNKGTHQA